MTNNNDNNGCGCIVLIIIAIVFGVVKCVESSTEPSKTQSSVQNYENETSHYYDASSTTPIVEDEISEEDKMYLSNSLSTGDTPYKKYYGDNYRCPYSQCSGIAVTAPKESDIVVIIKRNNQSGKVIAHGYIQKGHTHQFDLPDGTYQTFFYYGRGWNPDKEMENDIKGGFVTDEIFSKDNPQKIYSGVLSYVLQLQTNGNFQTKGSNANEVF